MSEPNSTPASTLETGVAGTCIQVWTGSCWMTLPGCNYCNPPYTPPPGDHMPHPAEPGIVAPFACQFGSSQFVAGGSADRAAIETGVAGTCIQYWDGWQWDTLPGCNYCNLPYVPPYSGHMPHGEPGVQGPPTKFACVSPTSGQSVAGESADRAAAEAALRSNAADGCSPGGSAPASAGEHPPVSKFNLIYHVFANAANDIWLRNVRQLRRRLGIFNGRKVVAIATGPGLVHPDDVQAAFAWPGVEFLLVPNDGEIGQTASFPALLAAVRSKNADEATFYAHTKGAANGSQDPKAIEYWRNAMYASLLDDLPGLQAGLRRFAALGACMSLHPGLRAFPSQIPWGNWHFAGTFFWFRHDRVFNDCRYTFVPHDYYGVEAWLGGFLAAEEAGSLLQPRPKTDRTWTCYDRGVWTDPIADEPPPASQAGPRFSVVIPCKGRLAHLRHVLPYWLKQETPPAEIIVVDYGCPEHCGDWVNAAYPQIRVVRTCHDVERFNASRARNLGAVAAGGDYLAFADADFIAPPDYLARVAREIRAGCNLVCIAHYDHGELGLNGTCTVSAELYHRVRGYDESNPTYGFEDPDFYRRCAAAGCARGYLHNCQCMNHSDEERMRFYPHRDKAEAIRVAAAWAADTSRAVNPRGYGQP